MQMLIYFVITMALSILLAPKMKTPTMDPGQIDSDAYPEAKDKPIQRVYGKAKIMAPNTTWWGKNRTEKIREKVADGGWFSSDKWATTGFRYFTSMQLALCSGPVTLHRIWDDDIVVYDGNLDSVGSFYVTGDTTQTITTFRRPFNFYHAEGWVDVPREARNISSTNKRINPKYDGQPMGLYPDDYYIYDVTYTIRDDSILRGHCDFFPGHDNQPVSGKLRSWTGNSNLPNYGGLSYLLLDDLFIGEQPSLRPISVEVSHYPKSPAGNTAWEIVDGDANPAYVIYDLLKHELNAGIDDLVIDIDSIERVAEKCFNEGLGISFVWSTPSSISDIISNICEHCDLIRRENHEIGKIELYAIRPDYDIASLPVLDENNISAVQDHSKPSVDVLNTEVSVTYLDRSADYTQRSVASHNIGTVNNRRQRSKVSKEYTFFTKPSLAQWAADRDLSIYSNGSTSAQVTVNRDGAMLNIGDPVLVKMPFFNSLDRIYRVQSIDLGGLTSNRVSLNLVEDVFGRSPGLYKGISGERSADTPPTNVADLRVFELPLAIAPQSVMVFADAPPEGGNQLGYRLATKLDFQASFNVATGLQTINYASNLTTDVVITASDTVMPLAGYSSLSGASIAERKQGANLAVVIDAVTGDQEVISFGSAITDATGNATLNDVWRGLLDTLPMDISAGSRVHFFSDDHVPLSPLEVGDSYQLRALSVTDGGTLDIAEADSYTHVMSDRYSLPNAPSEASVSDNVDGDMVFTIKRRSSDYSAILPLAEVAETGAVLLDIYDALTDELLHTEVVEASSWTWTSEIVQTGTDANGDPVYSERHPETYTVVRGWDGEQESLRSLTISHVRA